MKTQKQSAVIGAAGEHLVLSNLLRLNYIAGKAPDNTKDYDLVVLNSDGTTSFPIQVKTTIDKKKSWILSEKHEKPIKNLIYCFVYIESKSSFSEIFVINSEAVAKAVKTSHSIWLKLPGLKGQKHQEGSMRMFMRDYSSISGLKRKNYKNYLNQEELKFILDFSDGWLNKYRDNWSLIKK
jgi:hypothetical protein